MLPASSLHKPRIPLSVPDLRGREGELLQKCVVENWVSSAGPEVAAFEQRLAHLTGRKHAVAVVNGTAGLHLALMITGIGSNDEVVVPDWTFAATANAVCHAGAKPVLVDVDDSDWALDPELVEQALSSNLQIKGIIAVDPVGHAADFNALLEVCRSYDVPLIEDAAGAIGASYRGKPCGSFGDVSVISFNGNKTVTAGGGGVVLTDDNELAERARHISTQARDRTAYLHDQVGYNYRMTNINAAVGLAQLEQLSSILNDKAEIVARYDAALLKRNDIRPMPRPHHTKNSGWLYNVEVSSPEDAQDLVANFGQHNIEARVFWQALSTQAPWSECRKFLQGVSHRLSGRVVSLPSSSSLTAEEQGRVLEVIAAWHGSNVCPENNEPRV